MLTTTASAVPHIGQGRARALGAAGGALAAALAWIVEVPLLGVHLNVRFGPGHIETISIGLVIGVTVAASLFGWLLLALLERRTPRARLGPADDTRRTPQAPSVLQAPSVPLESAAGRNRRAARVAGEVDRGPFGK